MMITDKIVKVQSMEELVATRGFPLKVWHGMVGLSKAAYHAFWSAT
jgi:hypothetical protein